MNIDDLYKKYPLVFPKGNDGTIQCNSGWFLLLDCLFSVINKELTNLPENERKFEILQLKEKFGSLNIYHSGGTPYINETIVQAEEMSEHICETCGEYGEMRDSWYWIKVRCDECEKKHIINRQY